MNRSKRSIFYPLPIWTIQVIWMPNYTKAKRRTITLHKEDYHLALPAARERENTRDFKREYAKLAGIQCTISQGVRAFGLRRAKYIGLAKTHLQHVHTATAMHFARISN